MGGEGVSDGRQQPHGRVPSSNVQMLKEKVEKFQTSKISKSHRFETF